MRRLQYSLILFLIFLTASLLLNISFYAAQEKNSIPGTLNMHTIGATEDYHQFMFIIRRGIEGHLLYHNAYSEENIPDIVLQPYYHVLAYILGYITKSPYYIYFFLHMVSLTILLLVVYWLIRITISSELFRSIAVTLFFSANGFWSKIQEASSIIYAPRLPDYNFDMLKKLIVMPAHHDTATSLFIIILIAISLRRPSYTVLFMSAVAAALLGFIHPFILMFLFYVIILDAIFRIIVRRDIDISTALQYGLPIISAIPVSAFSYYVLVHILQFEIGLKGITIFLPRTQHTYDYFLSLGPVFFISLLSMMFIKPLLRSTILRIQFLWAYLPIVLFYLPDFHIPMNTWRLFQTYQHIPMAILSSYALSKLFHGSVKYKSIAVCITIVLFIYSSVACILAFKAQTASHKDFNFTIHLPISVISLFTYLRQHTPEHSVVIAGARISNILPTFTENHVVNGHTGDNRNYVEKYNELYIFLLGKTPLLQVAGMLKKYHASYLIFGIDAVAYSDTPYGSLPYLKVVYTAPGTPFSIIQVLADK